MAEYLHPGVYVEEVSSGIRPLEGVGTSTAAFIGRTAKGIPNRPIFITGWKQFTDNFGGFLTDGDLPHSVLKFYENGGKRCYVVRVLDSVSATPAVVDLTDREGTPRPTLRVLALGAGAWGNSLMVRIENGGASATELFRIIILHEGEEVERYDNLTMNPTSPDYAVTTVNDASQFVEIVDLGAADLSQRAESAPSAALADPVPFAPGGEDFTITMEDGTSNTIAFTGDTAQADVTAAIQSAWGALNVVAGFTETGELVVTHNVAGRDRYFTLSGSATSGGSTLDGMAGFFAGLGPAIGGTMLSAAATTFDTTGGDNQLDITVNGDAIATIALTSDAATPIDTIVAEIDAALTSNGNNLVQVRRQADRVELSTANTGSSSSTLAIGGSAQGVLNFTAFDGAAGPVSGAGTSEPAFILSDAPANGAFTLTPDAALQIQCNNGVLGAEVSFSVQFSAPNVPNFANVSPQTIAQEINTAAPAGSVQADVVDGRVRIRQARSGNAYWLQLTDGASSPNVRLAFATERRSGYGAGDATSPYYRPRLNIGTGDVNLPQALTQGDDGAPVSDVHYVGSPDGKTGLHALDDIDDVNFIAVPGEPSPSIVAGAVGYCARRKDCVFIADSPRPVGDQTTSPVEVRDFMRNQVPIKDSYGALYYPWVRVSDPAGVGRNPTRLVPPSGFVAGMYARIDNERGVWKAPAGTEANLFGALGLEYAVSDSEQDILNPHGVNCIRSFKASGLVIWGARTMGTESDPEWRYLPVRRYAIYLEQSIYRGTQWAVFEPNAEPLWTTLAANITDFMMGEFRKGALAGTTPAEAFFVKCDIELNPESEVNAGRVNMEVRFAPLKPAEFVVIRISQKSRSAG